MIVDLRLVGEIALDHWHSKINGIALASPKKGELLSVSCSNDRHLRFWNVLKDKESKELGRP